MTTATVRTSIADGIVNSGNLRAPVRERDWLGGTDTLTWTPDLTAAEQVILTDLTTLYSFGISASITLAEFQAIKPDLATAKAFLGIASPTQAQSNAALKSTIRILGALLRA